MQLSVDTVIGCVHEIYRYSEAEIDDLKLELLRQVFEHHYNANAFFRAQCEAEGLGVGDIQDYEDAIRIPLIPMRTFKNPHSTALMSVSLDEVEIEIKTTGTSGIPSVTRRDSLTTTRAILGLISMYREFFRLSEGVGLFLSPSLLEIPEMGLVKVLNLFTGMLNGHQYLVHEYAFDEEDAISFLEKYRDEQTRHIFGPPFLINRLLRHLEDTDRKLELDEGSFVVTVGGWKRFTGEFIGRGPFDDKLVARLGVQRHNIRDLYGMSECNMLAVECEHQNKHLPPWCHVSIRDLEDTSREVAPGQPGVIGIYDLLCTSYPAFVLSEDIGEIQPGSECPCGRGGQVIHFHRRLEGSEYGCCSISLDKFIEEGVVAATCEVG